MRNPPPSDATADSTSVAELTVIEFITRLGETTPAPGSGAAGAVALALAAGCAAKAFAISQRHNRIEALAAAATRARELARIALEGAQHEGDDFRRWLGLHSAAAAAALDEDSSELRCLSAALRDLISSHRRDVIPSLTADLDAALELASSFDAIAKKNAMELRASAR
jgi:Formiminotransferase-cyclodeaminase